MFGDIRRFFDDFFKKIKNKKFSKILPFVAVICIVAVLIPSIVAIWHTYFKKADDFEASRDISVSLWDIRSNSELASDTVNEENISDSAIVSLLYNMNSQEELSAPLDGAPESPNFRLTITTADYSVQYNCYFSEYFESSYLRSDDGKIYAVNEDSYRKFLESHYSHPVYSTAIPPSLTTADGATVTPSSVEWFFKKANGTFESSSYYKTTATEKYYQMSGYIELNFDIQPTRCDIEVIERSENKLIETELYSGDLYGLSYITAQPGKDLVFSVNAYWDFGEEVDCYGEISYNFAVECKDYATFEISKQKVLPGEFISIVLHDVTNSSSVIYSVIADQNDENDIMVQDFESDSSIFSSDNAITFLKNYKPQFLTDGSELIALLPIPYGTPSGNFTFSLSSGVAEKYFTIEIGEALPTDTVTLSKTYVQLINAISQDALDGVEQLLKNISAKTSQGLLFNGAFNDPSDAGYKKEYSFGDRFIISDLPQNDLIALGNCYSTSAAGGSNVYAANSGVVIYVGNSKHMGNTVVVDHGMGLCTWYCNLSYTDVWIGDVVAKDELVGKSGQSTLLSTDGVLILCSVYDVLIDPDLVLGNEISYSAS